MISPSLSPKRWPLVSNGVISIQRLRLTLPRLSRRETFYWKGRFRKALSFAAQRKLPGISNAALKFIFRAPFFRLFSSTSSPKVLGTLEV